MAFYAGRLVLRAAAAKPDDRGASPIETTWTTSSSARSPAATNCCGRLPSRQWTGKHLRARLAGFVRRRGLHHHPEVHADARVTSYPQLSDRRNIIVIADEAHRSQYDFIDGFARHMRDALPNASFIGFTGTPIEKTDANTRAVFGDYISVYDIQRAVEDKATVPIYYESRLAKLDLDDSEKPKIDPDFEEATEGEEVERRETAANEVGRAWKQSLAPRSVCGPLPKTLCTISRSGWKQWTARRWSSA